MQENSAKRDTPEAERIQTGEGHVARSDLQRKNVIYEPEHYRHDDEKNHRRAVHGEKLIESIRVEKMIVRQGQLQPHEERLNASDHKKEQSRQEIENGDAFVINRGKPGESIVGALGRIKNGRAEHRRGCCHAVHRSDERYSASWSSCSSVKVKSGMSAPGLMCCGLLSQRRMFAEVFSRMPAPSCLRLATWVRSGATPASAPVTPRMAWQLIQVDV